MRQPERTPEEIQAQVHQLLEELKRLDAEFEAQFQIGIDAQEGVAHSKTMRDFKVLEERKKDFEQYTAKHLAILDRLRSLLSETD